MASDERWDLEQTSVKAAVACPKIRFGLAEFSRRREILSQISSAWSMKYADTTTRNTQVDENRPHKRSIFHVEPDPLPPEPEVLPPPPQPAPFALPPTRFGRLRRPPKAFQDMVPSAAPRQLEYKQAASLLPPPSSHSTPEPQIESHDPSPIPQPMQPESWYETEPDQFGFFRRYRTKPARDMDDEASPDPLTDTRNIAPATSEKRPEPDPLRSWGSTISQQIKGAVDWFAPFLNVTVFRLMYWVYTGSTSKSTGEIDRLVNDVLLSPDFDREHLRGFSMSREEKRLDKAVRSAAYLPGDNWLEDSAEILMPKERVSHASMDAVPTTRVDGIWRRDIVAIADSICKDTVLAHQRHFNAFEQWHRDPDSGKEQRIHGEVYTSDAMLEEEAKVRSMPRNPADDPNVEYCVMPFTLYSDGTALANFGTASLWTGYMHDAGLSKEIRCKANSFAAHHIAYFPSLPKDIQDRYKDVYGQPPSKDVLKFMKTELVHAIWLLVLNLTLMEAYINGFLVHCGDGILRRMFIRFFLYCSDYPERVLMLCLKFLANCPCPNCYTLKRDVPQMGLPLDMRRRAHKRIDNASLQADIAAARDAIFLKGAAVDGVVVKALLNERSMLPTRNAFSIRLASTGFNAYAMFAPDMLHTFELGVWRTIFVHILRVLNGIDKKLLAEFDRRFRRVPTFGTETIRRFHNNVSELKKLAARDYEDILQCVIPCIEGLLPAPLERVVFDMLWHLLLWHAMAKLRMHTEPTIRILEHVTTDLGRAVRIFAHKSKAIPTYELKRESDARKRREIATKKSSENPKRTATTGERKIRHLNMKTFKWHDLPHVAEFIRKFGTTENFSTQWGETEHKRVKRWYGLTSKNKHEGQIAMKQERAKIMRFIKQHEIEAGTSPTVQETQADEYFGFKDDEKEDLVPTRFDIHHQIGEGQRFREDLHTLVAKNPEDRALKNFVPDLLDHLLSRILENQFNGEEHSFTNEQRSYVRIVANRIYRHQVMCVNYTTYNARRDQDSINPRTHADIMLLNPGEDDVPEDRRHPYWYARVYGIFHANVQYLGPEGRWLEPRRMEFLWVRWFGRDLSAPCGFGARRLPRIGFVDGEDSDWFCFLDPSLVIRGVHVIPAFHFDKFNADDGQLVKSALEGARSGDDQSDYKHYYVNIFVDRDMIMRYLGGGIGHHLLRGLVNIADTLKTILGDSFSLSYEDEEMADGEDEQEDEELDFDEEDALFADESDEEQSGSEAGIEEEGAAGAES
ncbi:hypothetical protein NM688_g3242 [Phlebia brevispora]|uniref:Uncharacterized protein n=1 Tax=Phlebia brevispora TaxID=194682 RepID=A0ACC1T6F8_9APHY|nr:hypothetical protein NM688_g3242 [Phlebia brevispora]